MTSNTLLLAAVVLIAYPLSLMLLLWWRTRDINVATHPYIDLVVNNMPRAIPLRTQVTLELQSHFAERVDGGSRSTKWSASLRTRCHWPSLISGQCRYGPPRSDDGQRPSSWTSRSGLP